jgi:hypothetical protein
MSSKRKMIRIAIAAPVLMIFLMACSHFAMMAGTPKPAADEFGYGPRKTSNGSYTVTIEESVAFKTSKLLNTVIRVQDTGGKGVDDATITVDGGMPQHGHGLPTKPRVTKNLGDGRYQVSGLKFNMGGWWELKFAIAAAAATDSITFNLEL